MSKPNIPYSSTILGDISTEELESEPEPQLEPQLESQLETTLEPTTLEPTTLEPTLNIKKRTMFDSRQIVPETTMTTFIADLGTFTPISVKTDDYIIIPFQKSTQQDDAFQLLNSEFPQIESIEMIQKEWYGGTDILYVMEIDNEIVGTIAIDRKKFYPFVSNLVIKKSHRNQGLAQILLHFAEHFSLRLKFQDITLWCKPELRKFYEKMQFHFEKEEMTNQKEMVLIMKKPIYI